MGTMYHQVFTYLAQIMKREFGEKYAITDAGLTAKYQEALVCTIWLS